MAKCKHKHVREDYWNGVLWIPLRNFFRHRPAKSRIVCRTCGHWLPLAPADDTPEAMIELRAAELADDWDTSPVQDPVCLFRGREWQGWIAHGHPFIGEDVTDEQAAGYLARAIVRHDEEVRNA